MSKELIALVYNFLVEKDATCAEIFKRGFEPDITCAQNLPPLEEIGNHFINSKKNNIKKKPLPEDDAVVAASDARKIMEIAQKNPSNFLEHIIKKRDGKNEERWSSSDSDTDDLPEERHSSTSSSEDIVVSAKKRRKLNSGANRKVWTNKKEKNKNKLIFFFIFQMFHFYFRKNCNSS